MKRALFAIALLLFAVSMRAAETCSSTATDSSGHLYGPQGELPACLALDSVTSEVSSAVIQTYGYRVLNVHVWAAVGTATAVVDINCRAYATAPWFPCASITNPAAGSASSYYTLPRAHDYQVTVRTGTYGGGTISAAFERYAN